MALEKYQQKRRFDETPEPAGKKRSGRGALKFVVQKHQASHLHYDFRLELGGVLVSWAVPKGPSLKPKDKRLAMMVEDHPYDYRGFEGIIPQGNYGGGTVMVWDQGTYQAREVAGKKVSRAEAEKLLRQGLHKGDLKIVLDGQKLKGEFALVKIRQGEEKAWLLIKKDDEQADRQVDVTKQDRSAATGRTMPQIANQSEEQGDVWQSHRSQDMNPDNEALKQQNLISEILSGASPATLPRDVKPMLATLTDQPFDRKGWLFEVKWDGYRAVAEVEQGSVNLYSRNLQPFNQKFAPIVKSLEQLGHRVVLDGEVVAVNEDGKPSFQLLQNYHKSQSRWRGQTEFDGANLIYYVFDILYLDGHDLTGLPLTRRKQILAQILPALPSIRISEHIEERGIDFFNVARDQQLEGIMAKDGQSTYRPGIRTKSWLKIKTHQRQEAVIGG
ncbi:MAG TPA: DNA polymerase ligase N-terminal domain-containing protein, partial [Candidatus Saccharimonadales bacterium]|nr:DNA polymerase ligase N-terminal domain-containing protein [Candidatus Saccharimonadales bacterium]